MKTNKLLLILLFIFSFHAFAQTSKEGKKEQIKALKIGYITNELALTPEEATKFWPLYNTFNEKQYQLKHTKMKALKEKAKKDIETMTEKEASALLSQMQSIENELYLLQKNFIKNLKGVLPSVKILKLKKAENDFNKKLLQQYRDHGAK